jgi:multiple sugar transport system substrate-binding protein
MKYVFGCCLLLLIGATVVTWRSLPDAETGRPVLYWVTDPNPARDEQVRLFQEWLLATRSPDMLLKLDTGNSDGMKKIIQGVSGVGGDIMDLWLGGNMRYFDAMGLLQDVTDEAARLGFGPDATFPSLLTEITIEQADGSIRQFQFPCNIYIPLYIVNKEQFARVHQPLPPRTWTVEEFERLGKQYIRAANPDTARVRFFYADNMDLEIVRRSFGATRFNETLTRCTLDAPANVKAMELIRKWMEVDRILPTAADKAGFTTGTGYGGPEMQLFESGNYAMTQNGRHAVIQFRNTNKARAKRGEKALELGVSFPPYADFPNTFVGTRAAAVYAGTPHLELAPYFLAYLASESYNMQIVRDGDGLPPNPRYCETDEYLRPPEYPNEWEVHPAYKEAAETIAIGTSYSPFVLYDEVIRVDDEARDFVYFGVKSAAQAGADAAVEVNRLIDRTLEENPQLRDRYQKLLADQERIDQLKQQGAKIPRSLVRNPYHIAYFRFKGLLEEGDER